MFIFNSPAIPEKTWKLYLKSKNEMLNIYYEDTEPEDRHTVFGITEYATSTVYIAKDIESFFLLKILRHELMHVYLWDLEKNGKRYTEDEITEILEVAAPLICKIADELAFKIEKNHMSKCLDI